MANSTEKIEKGDVILVPYRKDYWPALVHHVYAKKVTYSFFPIRDDENIRDRFTVAPRLAYAMLTAEPLPSDPQHAAAFRAASAYLSASGKTRGSLIDTRAEAELKRKNERKRKRVSKNHEEAVEEQHEIPVPKKETPTFSATTTTTSSAETSSESASDRRKNMEKQSKELMKLINRRLESLINEIWNSEEAEKCKNQAIGTKMTVKLRNNRFLTESDYSSLFERIVSHVRTNRSISLIGAFHVTATCLLPHVLITCYATWKHVDIRTAKEAFFRPNNTTTPIVGLDASMNIPVTDHLEELCRLACDESAAI